MNYFANIRDFLPQSFDVPHIKSTDVTNDAPDDDAAADTMPFLIQIQEYKKVGL